MKENRKNRHPDKWLFLAGAIVGIASVMLGDVVLSHLPANAGGGEQLQIIRADYSDRDRVRCKKGLTLSPAGLARGGQSVWVIPASIPAGEYAAICL